MNDRARPWRLAFWGLVALIAASRLTVALADHRSLIAQDVVQDDAFYYFKIAGHLADGDGPSFDGETMTSGFQPLWTLLLVPLVALTRGDVVTPIHLALVVSGLFSIGSGWLIHGWVRREVGANQAGEVAGLAAMALFAVSPYFLFLGVNGLETGLAIFFALAICRMFATLFGPHAAPPPARVVAFGAVCGLAILARVDLALLMLALGAAAAFDASRTGALPAALRRALLAGAVALAVWLPWGLYGHARTGDWLPASGAASRQIALNYGWSNLTPIWGDPATHGRLFDPADPPAAFHADVGATLVAAFALEHPLLGPFRANAGFEIWPRYARYFPYRWLRRAPRIAPALALVAVALLALALARSARSPVPAHAARPSWGLAMALYLALHAIGYTFYCPAHWYLTRYQAPAVALTLALAVALVGCRFTLLGRRGRLAAGVVLAILLATQLSLYRGETASGLRWQDATPGRFLAGWYSVAPHLDPSKKLAAFQAGTFAWFGRRDVVNLDGKVNPDAARALRRRRLDAYIAGQGIEQLVDWPWIVETLCLRHVSSPEVRLTPIFGAPDNYGFVLFEVAPADRR